MTDTATPADSSSASPLDTGTANSKPSTPSTNSSLTVTPNGKTSPSQPVTMPSKRQEKLEQMLWHSLMEVKGEVVAVTTKHGKTYSGVLFAIEPATFPSSNTPSTPPSSASSPTSSSTLPRSGAWATIVLKYVQEMSNPNRDPSERIRAGFQEEVRIAAHEFASLSARGIADHTNAYRRADRKAFDDATGKRLHRAQRELQRWQPDGSSLGLDEGVDLLEDGGLDDSDGEYDQFEANNCEATFDENMYTSKLDTGAKDFERRRQKARDEEAQIMAQETSNRHVRDDRAYYLKKNELRERRQRGKDEDEEDAYSKVLGLNKGKQKKKKGVKGGYVPPHMRGKEGNSMANSGSQSPNAAQKSGKRKPPRPMNGNGNNKRGKQNNNQRGDRSRPMQPRGVQQNVQSQQANVQAQQQQQIQQTPQQAFVQQAQQQQQQQTLQMLQRPPMVNTGVNNVGGVASLPPHIARILQSTVQPKPSGLTQNVTESTNVGQQSLQTSHQQQMAQQYQLINAQQQQKANNESQPEGNPTQNCAQTPNSTVSTPQNAQQNAQNAADKEELNPNAIEFTPTMSPNTGKGALGMMNNGMNTAMMNPAQQTQLALQQQMQAQQLAQLSQYSYNPATGQYVLNPYVAQQQQAYMQQLALLQQQQQQQQQQAQAQNGTVQQQQQLLAQQMMAQQVQQAQQAQAQAQQAQLVLQQAQAQAAQQQQQAQAQQGQVQGVGGVTGLNIGAPMFTPSGMQGNAVGAQQNQLLVQQQQVQALQQQQQLQQALQQQQIQQYLASAAQQQQQAQAAQQGAQGQQFALYAQQGQQGQQPQFYLQNMQNLMPQ